MKRDPARKGKTRTGATAAALLALFAGALLLRVLPFLALPPGSGHPILDSDSLYHLRLAQLTFHDYPRVPGFDPYLNFPIGAKVPWPLLQEFTAATLARVLALSQGGLEALCSFLPALLGSVFPLGVYLLARALGMGRGPALGAGALSGLVPVHLQYSMAGIFDHHAGDALLAVGFFLAVMASWSTRTLPLRSPKALPAQAGLALAALLMFLNWQGSVVYVALLLLAAFLAHLGAPRDPALSRWFVRTGSSLAVSAALLFLLDASAYGLSRMGEIVLAQPSSFHPLFLAASASAFFALAAFRGRDSRPGRGFFPWLAGAGFLAACLLLASPGADAFLAYLGGGNRAFRPFPEFLPPFFTREGGFGLTFARGVGLLSWGAFLPPLAFAAVLGRRGRREGGEEAEGFPRHLLLVLLGGLFLLAMWQARWGNAFAIAGGLSAGTLLSLVWRWARDGAFPGRKGLAAGVTLLVTLGFLAPACALVRDKWVHPRAGLPAFPLLPTLEWMRGNTPAPSDPFRPDQPPSYGVLALPVEGHPVIALGRRPAAVTAFGNTLPGGLFASSLAFFVETDPRRARDFMRENRLRYLLLPEPRVVDWVAGNLLEGGGRRGDGGLPVSEVLWRFAGSAWAGDGGPVEGAPFWRLVWEDEQPDGGGEGVAPVKLFELVRGAVLTGQAPPGSWVSARLTLRTRLRPEVPWQAVVRANQQGRYSLTVPYPTEAPSGTTRPLGPYWVEVRGREPVRVIVGEDETATGRQVEVR